MFTVSADQLGHLKIVRVRRETWSFAVRTTGTVDWNADQTTSVIAQVSGPIVRIAAHPGTSVRAGDPLLYVASPDVSNAIANYRKARTRLDLARRTLGRNRDLLEHRAIAEKEVESSQADYEDAATEVESSLQALKIFGVTREEIQQAETQGVPISTHLAVRAPISGVVVQQLVLPGQLVQAGATVCFLVSDVSSVWVQGNVFDKDLAAIRLGDAAETVAPSSTKRFRGHVSYIGAIVDPATRATPVRIVTKNPNGFLKKDMFVDVVIHTRTRRGVLTAPLSAVLHDPNNQPFLYVEAEPGKFSQRLVTLGEQQGSNVEIVDGCKEGEQIVSEGGVFLQFANAY